MSKYVVAVLVVGWTIASVPLGLFIWPAAGGHLPQQLVPIFTLVLLFEGAAFAGGMVVLVRGRNLLSSVGQSPLLTRLAYLSVAWLLLNWWPHDGLHRTAFGRTYQGLAIIDITFHTTLIAAGAVVAVFFFRAIKTSLSTLEPERAVREA